MIFWEIWLEAISTFTQAFMRGFNGGMAARQQKDQWEKWQGKGCTCLDCKCKK
jgi:hypothetical protein